MRDEVVPDVDHVVPRRVIAECIGKRRKVKFFEALYQEHHERRVSDHAAEETSWTAAEFTVPSSSIHRPASTCV